MTPLITFAAAYRGRRHHAMTVIPQNLRLLQDVGIPFEYHVLDFNCHDDTGAWVTTLADPALRVFKNTDEPYWWATVAQNTIVAQAETDWVALLMGDNVLQPAFGDFLRGGLEPGCFYTYTSGQDPDTWGTMVFQKSAFDRINGYDEEIQGWGNDDVNLLRRLVLAGVQHRQWPQGSIKAIPHSNEERFGLQREPVTYIEAFKRHAKYLTPHEPVANIAGRKKVSLVRLK